MATPDKTKPSSYNAVLTRLDYVYNLKPVKDPTQVLYAPVSVNEFKQNGGLGGFFNRSDKMKQMKQMMNRVLEVLQQAETDYRDVNNDQTLTLPLVKAVLAVHEDYLKQLQKASDSFDTGKSMTACKNFIGALKAIPDNKQFNLDDFNEMTKMAFPDRTKTNMGGYHNVAKNVINVYYAPAPSPTLSGG